MFNHGYLNRLASWWIFSSSSNAVGREATRGITDSMDMKKRDFIVISVVMAETVLML